MRSLLHRHQSIYLMSRRQTKLTYPLANPQNRDTLVPCTNTVEP
ncbi:NS7b protein [White-eye coronavirus HKU16]|uniref:NS7b protein n=1 Tax=White-eye coronavirus HKU16 TaxID=1159907 RepID=H9BQZ8_9NIDO|nr:NS7b protein [White-eye coronavirus HKU16]AFD29207.1 NS7b protein [White-eye coronavirus HKU16]